MGGWGEKIIFLCSLSTKVVKYSKTETLEKTALRCITFDRPEKKMFYSSIHIFTS